MISVSLFTAAVYTYYNSLSSENRLKKNGKYEERRCARRRRERLLRVCTTYMVASVPRSGMKHHVRDDAYHVPR